MSEKVLNDALLVIKDIILSTKQTKLKITFHGGEPLLAGHDWFNMAFENIFKTFPFIKNFRFSIQSNLWDLDNHFCDLFKKFKVSIGTSLDGPMKINDINRGLGSFNKTFSGLLRAKAHGLKISAISTITNDTACFLPDILEFFKNNQIGVAFHPSLPSGNSENDFSISPEKYSKVLSEILKYQIANSEKIVIFSIIKMARSLIFRKTNSCVFGNCLGKFFVFSPNRSIFSCQRFASKEENKIGDLDSFNGLNSLYSSPFVEKINKWRKSTISSCSGCPNNDICFGGCPFNSLNSGNLTTKDPYCISYFNLFAEVKKVLFNEMTSPENIDDIVNGYSKRKHPLFSVGKLTHLALK